MHTVINRNLNNFSWIDILKYSKEFEQNPFNPRIFSLKFLADISTLDNQIRGIHPHNRRTLNAVAMKLSQVLSEYYQEDVAVTITEEDTISICFFSEI